MLNFFKDNPIFYNIILFLFFINFVLTIVLDKKEQKQEKKKESLDTVIKIKTITMTLAILLFLVIISLKAKNYIVTLVFLFIPAFFLTKNLYAIYQNKQTLSIDDKFSILWSMYIFFVFFSTQATQLYNNLFTSLNHYVKETLLICYLLMKMALFIYFLLQNIAILISNITILFTPRQKINKLKNILDNFINYDFYLYKKFNSNMAIIADTIIFFILSIPTIILYIFKNLLLKPLCDFTIEFVTKIMNTFISRSNKIIRKTINISIIVIVSLVNIIIIINSSVFSDITKEVFNFVATVILIPFIYDSVKSN